MHSPSPCSSLSAHCKNFFITSVVLLSVTTVVAGVLIVVANHYQLPPSFELFTRVRPSYGIAIGSAGIVGLALLVLCRDKKSQPPLTKGEQIYAAATNGVESQSVYERVCKQLGITDASLVESLKKIYGADEEFHPSFDFASLKTHKLEQGIRDQLRMAVIEDDQIPPLPFRRIKRLTGHAREIFLLRLAKYDATHPPSQKRMTCQLDTCNLAQFRCIDGGQLYTFLQRDDDRDFLFALFTPQQALEVLYKIGPKMATLSQVLLKRVPWNTLSPNDHETLFTEDLVNQVFAPTSGESGVLWNCLDIATKNFLQSKYPTQFATFDQPLYSRSLHVIRRSSTLRASLQRS